MRSGLEQLSETTLLFLNNLRYISWKVGRDEGAVLREEHSVSHVEVWTQLNGQEVTSSHWLRFSEPVKPINGSEIANQGVAIQKVAVAYELTLLEGKQTFDEGQLLASQMKIAPADNGSVSVFFPAEKETSGLRFHLHAPFVPELSRASIKDTPANAPLFAQLASLAAKSLHEIKDIGLLTGEFLSVLPNKDDTLPERYVCIRDAILNEMRDRPLVPQYGGGFAPASQLLQARASVKALLNSTDLALVTGRNYAPNWAIGYTQRNSNLDRFLASLGMQEYGAADLQDFFERRARELQWEEELEPEDRTCFVEQEVLDWIDSKSFEWLQSLYSLLYKHCEEVDDYGALPEVYFIKLVSEEIGTAEDTFFLSSSVNEAKPERCVDMRVLTAGTKKSQQDEARLFLEALGVREPNEADAIRTILAERYSENVVGVDDDRYAVDLKRFVEFSENFRDLQQVFGRYRIFRAGSGTNGWASASQIFLDVPFKSTGISDVYSAGIDRRRQPLSDWYATCGIAIDRISRFAEWVGAQVELERPFCETTCMNNPNWDHLRKAPGQRSGNGIDRDFKLTQIGLALLEAKRVDFSRIVWKALCRAEYDYHKAYVARFRWNAKGGHRDAPSQLVHSLRALAWVPQCGQDGETIYVRPAEATISRLPNGFAVDAGFKWLSEVYFAAEEKKRSSENAELAEHRAALGITDEEMGQRVQVFVDLPEDEQKRILELAKTRREPVELPERPLRNSALRQDRVTQAAAEAPQKTSVMRERLVQVGSADAKAAAKMYLVDQYTNSHGTMVCQVCKDELPFRLPNGSYYFEAVEIIEHAPKRYREGYLALCPNHAAAFQYSNAQGKKMHELIAIAIGSEIEVTLGGKETTIYFTQTHLADARACFSEDANEEH